MEEKQAPSKARNVGDLLREFREHRDAMRQELAKVIIGQDDVVEQCLRQFLLVDIACWRRAWLGQDSNGQFAG